MTCKRAAGTDVKPVTRHPKPETRDPRPEIRNCTAGEEDSEGVDAAGCGGGMGLLRPETRTSNLEMRNYKYEMRDAKHGNAKQEK